MTLQTWWLFLGAVFLLSGTPGPNMLHVMTRSARYGLRPSVFAMAGCLSGLVMVLLAAAAGLGAVLAASPVLFEILRYAGVAYLAWAGIRAWRGAGGAPDSASGLTPPPAAAGLFRSGFLIAVSNPKLLMFVAAFLPQFVDPARPQPPQFLVLISTFATVEAFWLVVYGAGGRRIAGLLVRPGARRLFDRLTGAVFLGFGAALLGGRP